MKRPLLLIPAVLLLVIAAAPRSAQVNPSAGIPVLGEATPGLSGAPQTCCSVSGAAPATAGPEASVRSAQDGGAPPTVEIGEPASYSKATPQPRIVSRPSGKVATWYPRTFGYGDLPTVALPDGHYIPAGRPVPYAVVCVFLPAARCETLPVVDFCGCGRNHIADLSLGAVALFGLDPSTGVWPATVQRLGGKP